MQIEKIDYSIDWRKFKAGYSFFIPCINCTEAKKAVNTVIKPLKIRIIIKTVIQEGVRGIRVWRI
jgi:hypothetical protein